ncbi:MAG: hypothetical protein AMS20_14615 [Gemmatimonas sp. SG8_28]|jgi:hypothetical protein|nr:MAG: hypothetical protein AMS20_14615 [Gemmatimonas sp. SG8_28]
MSTPLAEPSVLLLTADLFFRAKLDGIVRAAGARVVTSLPADLAVVELERPDAPARIGELVDAGVGVLSFGSHVRARALREARARGAVAVPNAEIEQALRRALREAVE